MSDDDTPLVRRLRATGPIRRSNLLADAPRAPLPTDSVLYGEKQRVISRPNVALQTLLRLGPVRHALAQRAICGIIEVHAPFSPPPKK